MNETQENKQITEPGREEFEKTDIFGVGAPNDGFVQYFVGNSFLKPLTEPGKCPVFLANVTFEPGCRNNWHVHHGDKGGGQILRVPQVVVTIRNGARRHRNSIRVRILQMSGWSLF